jgi:hypothetical protein
MKGPGIAFIITGLMGFAFMIFSGINLDKLGDLKPKAVEPVDEPVVETVVETVDSKADIDMAEDLEAEPFDTVVK